MSKDATAKAELTQARLKELLHYDPETGLFTWLVATALRIRVGQTAGSINGHGYLLIGIDGRRYPAHRLAWLWMTGEWPVADIDHINRVRSDNRFSNFREATNSQNQSNRSAGKNNKSGVKGVYWHKGAKKWMAQIGVNGKIRSIGYFSDINDAAAAYANASREHFGEYARSDTP